MAEPTRRQVPGASATAGGRRLQCPARADDSRRLSDRDLWQGRGAPATPPEDEAREGRVVHRKPRPTDGLAGRSLLHPDLPIERKSAELLRHAITSADHPKRTFGAINPGN